MQKNTYGKFATAEELLRGYNALQQAFTQKCQQLAELNKQVAELSSKQAVDTTNQVVQGGASFDKTNNDITYGNASPKQNGTSVLPNVDGTNGTSPAFIVEERSPNPQTNVPDKNDILASFGAQQNNAKSGTNETSPLTSNGQSICPTVNTTDKDNVVQTIVDEGKATAVVPTADCEESSLRAAKENAAPTSNVSEQNAVRNNAVNAQQSSNNADCNGDKKMHTYQEICDKSASNTAVNDGAESTQNGQESERQTALDDLLRAQKMLAENKQLVKQILAGNLPDNPPTVMGGGGNLSLAMPTRPKTLREASELAKKIFD